jgi:hypothetical protein
MTHAMHELPKDSTSPTSDMDYVPCFFTSSYPYIHMYLVHVHVNLQDKLRFFYGSVPCRSDQDTATQAAMLLQTQISVCVLCVTPGSQEHDSPYGVLGGRAAAVSATTARFAGRPGRRCAGGAVGAPEFLTEGLLDLVSPGALPGLQLRGFHGWLWLACLCQKTKISYNTGCTRLRV